MASPASPAIASQRRRGAAIGRLWTDRRLWTKALFVVGTPIVALAVSLALFVYIDQAQQTTATWLAHLERRIPDRLPVEPDLSRVEQLWQTHVERPS